MKDIGEFLYPGHREQPLGPISSETARAIGNCLRSERQSRGMSLKYVYSHTFISVSCLAAIESGDFNRLPQGVYVAGFVKIYARFLDLYPQIETYLANLYQPEHLVVNVPMVTVLLPKDKSHSGPPRLGEYFLYLFLTKAERIYLIGDLTEEFNEVVERFGPRNANLWFYKQVIASLTPLIFRALKRLKGVLTLVELIQRITKT